MSHVNQNNLLYFTHKPADAAAWPGGSSYLERRLVCMVRAGTVPSQPVPRKVSRMFVKKQRTVVTTCPSDGPWVRTVDQVGNFKRGYLANGRE